MIKKIVTVVVLMLVASFANELLAGMGSGPPSDPCGTPPFPPCAVPIDGGITLLAGAGIALGARKMIKKK